jgi:hypothetical protein
MQLTQAFLRPDPARRTANWRLDRPVAADRHRPRATAPDVSLNVVDWLREAPAGSPDRPHVQPGAKRDEVAGVHGDALKIRLAAPAIERPGQRRLARVCRAAGGSAKVGSRPEEWSDVAAQGHPAACAPADTAQRLLGR